MNHKFLYTIFLASFFFSCTLSKQEKEPNDDINIVSAQSFNYVFPLKIRGTFKGVKDIDHFPIRIDQDGYYSISSSSIKGVDSRISLYNELKQLVIIGDDYYQNFGEYIPMIYLKKGRYFIRMEIKNNSSISYQSSNQYTIFINPYKMPLPYTEKVMLAKKPTTKLSDVQKLNFNIPLIGYYYPSLSVIPHTGIEKKIIDYLSKETGKDLSLFNITFYTFSLDKKGDFLLNLDLSATNDFDPIVGLFNTQFVNDLNTSKKDFTGTVLIRDNNEFDLGESIFNYSISGPDTYIIALISRSRLNYNNLIQAQKNYYTLQLSTKVRSNGYEREPNDTEKQANSIKNVFTKGSLDSFYDVDVFMLEELSVFFEWFGLNNPHNNKRKRMLALPTYASIVITSDYSTGLSFDILNSSGELLKTIDSFPGKDYNTIFNNFYIAPKTRYFIRVHHPQSSDHKVNKIANYQIEINMHKRVYSDYLLGLEPNDYNFTTKENPSTLNFFRYAIMEYINNKKDVDNFYYNVQETGTHHISLEGIPNISFVIKLFNSNSLVKTFTTRQGATKHELEHYFKKGQTIRFELSPQEPEIFNPVQPFILTVEKPSQTNYDRNS